jgi:hypothetical protein
MGLKIVCKNNKTLSEYFVQHLHQNHPSLLKIKEDFACILNLDQMQVARLHLENLSKEMKEEGALVDKLSQTSLPHLTIPFYKDYVKDKREEISRLEKLECDCFNQFHNVLEMFGESDTVTLPELFKSISTLVSIIN